MFLTARKVLTDNNVFTGAIAQLNRVLTDKQMRCVKWTLLT